MAAVGAAAACSSPTNGGNSGGAGSSTDACGRVFDAFAKVANACAQQRGLGASGDFVPSARDNFVKSCTNQSAAPGSGLTPAFIGGCADALAKVSGCADVEDLAACNTPTGTLADGAPCGGDSQCASSRCGEGSSSSGDGGATDAGSKPAYCGVCTPTAKEGAACTASLDCASGLACIEDVCRKRSNVAEGATCVFSKGGSTTVLNCSPGLYCDLTIAGTSYSGSCKKIPNKGEACKSECADGLYCKDGTCADRLAVGAPCSSTVQCREELACKRSGASGACTARTSVRVDAACDQETTFCEPGLSCVRNREELGTCKVPLAAGAACDEANGGVPCGPYLSCLSGTCQILDAQLCK
jgi:hypothetical protein